MKLPNALEKGWLSVVGEAALLTNVMRSTYIVITLTKSNMYCWPQTFRLIIKQKEIFITKHPTRISLPHSKGSEHWGHSMWEIL